MRRSSEKNVLSRFGKQVRLLRKSQKMSQEELAEKAGLHSTYIGGVERGERNLSLKSIGKIARALGTDIRELFLPKVEGKTSADAKNIVDDIIRVLMSREVDELRLIKLLVKDIDIWLSETKRK